MRFKFMAAILAVACVMTISSSTPDVVKADATAPAAVEEGVSSNPSPYTGTNGGTEALTFDWIPNTLPGTAQEGTAPTNTGTMVVSGATPGGSGIMVASFLQVDVAFFGISFLAASDSINLVEFYTYGYDAAGILTVPGVSQHAPFLAGITVYLQAYEFAPQALSSNGLAFPLLP